MYSSQVQPMQVFYSYSHHDEHLRERLEKHLALLSHQKVIATWSDRRVEPGNKWAVEIDDHINTAQIILLLVSADYLASDYCYGIEMRRALERDKSRQARVIPIILRPVDWSTAPFAELQALPRDAKPVTSWDDPEEAWASIAKAIRLLCQEMRAQSLSGPPYITSPNSEKISSIPILQVVDVFVKSGWPRVTFVPSEDYEALKHAIIQPGRGIIIEGPSGIGKTTAVRQALDELRTERMYGLLDPVLLSARSPEDVERIKNLSSLQSGIVIVDDFHHLTPEVQAQVVDRLKYLADKADSGSPAGKLVIIGIPRTGQALVDLSYDVATRIEVLRMGKVSDDLVLTMIQKGEQALNIDFDRKVEIALAAGGSLNIAQYLCSDICWHEHILQTQVEETKLHCDVNAAIKGVVQELALKFRDPIRWFAAQGTRTDTTCIELLKELPNSDDGFLSLPTFADKHPKLSLGVNKFLDEHWMDTLYMEHANVANFLFFDSQANALVAEDPQLTFYLRKLNFVRLTEEVGKFVSTTQQKVAILYSHEDAEWLDRLQIHLRAVISEVDMELWSDTRILAAANWTDQLRHSLDACGAIVLLVTRQLMAWEPTIRSQISKLLARAHEKEVAIIPLIVSPVLFRGTWLDVGKAHNSPEQPLATLPYYEQETSLVSLTRKIEHIVGK